MQTSRQILVASILLLAGCSSSTLKKIDTKTITENYGISNIHNLQFYELNYETWESNIQNNSFRYPVLISRPDCQHCSHAIEELEQYAEDNEITFNLYLLESNTIDDEDKIKISNDYLISSVPTFILMENHSISEIVTGSISQDLLDKLAKGQ